MKGTEPDWVPVPPAAYDIVTCWYPESGEGDSGSKLRPCLVMAVRRNEEGDGFACRVAYGTTALKIVQRRHLDLIIQDALDLDKIGLARPTRFDLDNVGVFPWDAEFFGLWSGYRTPRIGALTEKYVREYAFLILRRSSAK